MTTLLDPIDTRHADPNGTAINDTATAARRLRTTMAACRVAFRWWGTQKTLTPEQRTLAAEAFDADGQALSAGKKLIDTRHSAFRAVTAIRTKITETWKGQSLPFPEPGVRLIKQEHVEAFAAQLADFRVELQDAVQNLDAHYAELRQAAAVRLGSLFHAGDYPETLVGLFDVQCDFPAIEPPDYLMQLSPALYAQERARMEARFEEAVRLAETAFTEEFARLVEHLAERISGSARTAGRRSSATRPSATWRSSSPGSAS